MKVFACIALSISASFACAKEIDVATGSLGAVYSVFTDTFAVRNGMPSALTGSRVPNQGGRKRSLVSVDGCENGFGVAHQRFESGEQLRLYWSESGDRVMDALSVVICDIDEAIRKRKSAPSGAIEKPRSVLF